VAESAAPESVVAGGVVAESTVAGNAAPESVVAESAVSGNAVSGSPVPGVIPQPSQIVSTEVAEAAPATPAAIPEALIPDVAPLCPNRQAAPSAVWCFQCGADYTAEVTNCLECGVLTLPYPPTPVTRVGEEDEEHLIYDLHEWSWESRSLMASYMFTEGLVHAWQGASLVVREADEGKVDDLVVRVKDTELPSLDHLAAKTEYEMGELSDAQTDLLTELLAADGVGHEFNIEGDLVIQTVDEARVEKVFEVWAKALAEMDEEEFGPGLSGVDVPDLLGELYELTRRVERSVGDLHATNEMLEVVGKLHMLELPFGFSRQSWRGLRQASAELAELLFPGELEELLEELMGDLGDAELSADAEDAEMMGDTESSADAADAELAGDAEVTSDAELSADAGDAELAGDAEELSDAGDDVMPADAEETADSGQPAPADVADLYQPIDDSYYPYPAEDLGDELVSEIKSAARQLRKLLKVFV